MMKNFSIKPFLSALAIAAVLALTVSACTEYDNPISPVIEDETDPTMVNVSVTATISDMVDQFGKGIAYFSFIKGDRLYVSGSVDLSHRLGGYLDIVESSISADGRTARFTGFLEFRQFDDDTEVFVPYEPDLKGADPLSIFGPTFTLIHASVAEHFIVSHSLLGMFDKSFLSVTKDTGASLIDRLSLITDTYDSANRSIVLTTMYDCIYEFTIDGLTPGHNYGLSVDIYYDDYILNTINYSGDVTADGNGTARFAIIGAKGGDTKSTLHFTDRSDPSKSSSVTFNTDIATQAYSPIHLTATAATAQPSGDGKE